MNTQEISEKYLGGVVEYVPNFLSPVCYELHKNLAPQNGGTIPMRGTKQGDNVLTDLYLSPL